MIRDYHKFLFNEISSIVYVQETGNVSTLRVLLC